MSEPRLLRRFGLGFEVMYWVREREWRFYLVVGPWLWVWYRGAK